MVRLALQLKTDHEEFGASEDALIRELDLRQLLFCIRKVNRINCTCMHVSILCYRLNSYLKSKLNWEYMKDFGSEREYG